MNNLTCPEKSASMDIQKNLEKEDVQQINFSGLKHLQRCTAIMLCNGQHLYNIQLHHLPLNPLAEQLSKVASRCYESEE
jgi:hypothetical protein